MRPSAPSTAAASCDASCAALGAVPSGAPRVACGAAAAAKPLLSLAGARRRRPPPTVSARARPRREEGELGEESAAGEEGLGEWWVAVAVVVVVEVAVAVVVEVEVEGACRLR